MEKLYGKEFVMEYLSGEEEKKRLEEYKMAELRMEDLAKAKKWD